MRTKLVNTDLLLDSKVDLSICLITDLHDMDSSALQTAMAQRGMDLIAIAGDLTGRVPYLNEDRAPNLIPDGTLRFLEFCSSQAPTFYSLGNHEAGLSEQERHSIQSTGCVLLDNHYVPLSSHTSVIIGGYSSASAYHYQRRQELFKDNQIVPKWQPEWRNPDPDFPKQFAMADGFKILLCHHPEYYPQWIRDQNIDLVLSGHAHGGQIRLFGRGLFAPGQGFLPKYTAGIYERRLIVSRGIANTAGWIPRLFNPPELVWIQLRKK